MNGVVVMVVKGVLVPGTGAVVLVVMWAMAGKTFCSVSAV